jgi:RHS repeat-associated protein
VAVRRRRAPRRLRCRAPERPPARFRPIRSDARAGALVNRYYDPATGQFLSVDPLVDETDQAYAYTGGDPVDGTDPNGDNDSGPVNIIRTKSVDELKTECQEDPQAQVCGNCPPGVSGLECTIATYDPGYAAVAGFGTEIQAVESGCPFWTSFKYGLGGTAGLVGTGAFAGGAVEFGSGVIGDLTGPGGIPNVIYRGGSQTPLQLTDDGTGVSFRDSLSNALGERPVLRPGEKYFGVGTSQLPPGSVDYDNVPPGHVGVYGLTPEQIQNAIVEQGRFPR